MGEPRSFEQESYRRHAAHFDQHAAGGGKESHARTWRATDTVDAWRHERFYKLIDPLATSAPGAKWLTVWDGRYGTDAHYLSGLGCDVVASDISDVLLKEAQESGFIPAFRKENAEALSFEGGSFDYVLCKESYHHFPRPMRALYEMLRVAGHAVVLIEPNDVFIAERLLTVAVRRFMGFVRRLRGVDRGRHAYEPSGNYVFTISRREIEKVALGLNLPAIAFKGINDSYLVGVENENFADNGPLRRRISRKIRLRDRLCRLRALDYALLSAVIFKVEPSEKQAGALEEAGYEIVRLPRNPYVER